jgi:acyl-CoA synthetase (AMP-forming)/AMP-acid ligase II
MPRVTPPKRDPRYPDFPTIVHALAYAVAHRADAPALACLDRKINYAQYAQAVAALARRFGEADVAGERIAYLMRNSLDMAIALYAGMAAGAQVAPLIPPIPIARSSHWCAMSIRGSLSATRNSPSARAGSRNSLAASK